MPTFRIHYVNRNLSMDTRSDGTKSQSTVVTFPRLCSKTLDTLTHHTIDAEDEVSALAAAKRRFPHLNGNSLAVSPHHDKPVKSDPYLASRVH